MYSISDVNIAYENFSNILTSLFNKHFPLIKQSRKRSKDKKWVNNEVMKASNRKNALYRAWIRSKQATDKLAYLEYKKIYRKILTMAQKSYFQKTFDVGLNSTKAIWGSLNNLITLNPSKKITLMPYQKL